MLRRLYAPFKTGVRRYSNIPFPQEFTVAEKPTINQFKNPLIHTFLIASSTYMIIHVFVTSHEYEEEKKRLETAEKALEKEMYALVEEKAAKKRKWYFFWRS